MGHEAACKSGETMKITRFFCTIQTSMSECLTCVAEGQWVFSSFIQLFFHHFDIRGVQIKKKSSKVSKGRTVWYHLKREPLPCS